MRTPALWDPLSPTMSLPTLEATRVLDSEVREGESTSESVPVTSDSTAAPNHDEPVVTRQELGSYYCVYHYMFCSAFAKSLTASFQYITLEITCVQLVLLVIDSSAKSCVQHSGTRTTG